MLGGSCTVSLLKDYPHSAPSSLTSQWLGRQGRTLTIRWERTRQMLLDLGSLLKERQRSSDPENTEKWVVKESEIDGRGVFARVDIQTGETIFTESPLVIGSRAAPLPAACVSCLKVGVPLFACPDGCRLPTCGSAACASRHAPECRLFRTRLPQLKEGEHWSPLLYRALVPIRCLLLPDQDKALVTLLCQNSNRKLIETLMLKEELSGELSAEDEAFLELSCRVLNSAAFEIELEKAVVSWRGLYPLSGTLNHSCRPNTQHHYLPEGPVPVRMALVATEPLLAGQEITTSYCPLMWSTAARRHFLRTTKEFLCACVRCADPTEFGTYFSAHGCSCKGYILPVSSEDGSDWRCGSCGSAFSAKDVVATEAAMLRGKCGSHRDSYVTVQRLLGLVNSVGRKSPYKDSSDADLLTKEKSIKYIMDINDRLQLGRSRLKITLEQELRDTVNEINRRKSQSTKD